MNPVDAALAVTYRCNARCVMCGIWSGREVAESPPTLYRRLPASLRSVNITGGEPFLRDDLPQIVEAVQAACPKAEIVISTNGLLTERIVEVMGRLRGVGVAVSVDGIGETHDRVRGVEEAFVRAQATLRRLAEHGVGGVRLAFTATPENVDHFGRVYDLSRQLGAEFTCAVAQDSEHYFQTSGGGLRIAPEKLREVMEPVARAELSTASPKRWARAWFMRGLMGFVEGRGRPAPCRAGEAFFFMDPLGDVYPCNVLSAVMGNLNEVRFEELWRSERAQRARRQAAACPAGCWMVCTARPAMRRRKLGILAWALWRKIAKGPVL